MKTACLRTVASALALVVPFALASCHSHTTTPSSTVTSVVVNAPAFVMIGASIQVTDSATLSDGSMSTAGITLSVDTPTVATITSAGLLTGVSAGQVTVTATFQGRSGTSTIRVVPDFRGNWTGIVVLSACQGTGSFSCDNTNQGPLPPLTVLRGLTQINDTVTGIVDLADIVIPATGTIAVNGTLTLTGSEAISDPTVDLATLKNWLTSLSSPTTMTGTFAVSLSKTGANGAELLTFTLQPLGHSPSA